MITKHIVEAATEGLLLCICFFILTHLAVSEFGNKNRKPRRK